MAPPPPPPGKSRGGSARRSRSRNTTPVSTAPSESTTMDSGSAHTAYLQTPLSHLLVSIGVSYDDILERYGNLGGIPGPTQLSALAESLKSLGDLARLRGEACDRGMRELSKRRKERIEQERQQERADREAQEKHEELKRLNMKRKKELEDESRPPAVGARGVTRQDGLKQEGGDGDHGKSIVASSHPPMTTSHASDVPEAPIPPQRPASPERSVSPLSSHQPPPARPIMTQGLFGDDPSTFPDPTVYHIEPVDEDTPEERKKAIYGVASYPTSDLRDKVCQYPPGQGDKDYSNAKPANQVSFEQFQKFVEPYLRPLTEEDIAWLKERGDRKDAFNIPRRGARHYRERWAEEDGSMALDGDNIGRDAANRPHGSIEDMNDAVAETDEVSTSPMVARLLASLRPEGRLPADTNGHINGTGEPLTNGVTNGDAMETEGDTNGDAANRNFQNSSSSTYFPESQQPGWKNILARPDSLHMDERLKLELRHIGFLAPDDEPDYDAHYDDEVGERLRILQDRLRQQIIVNGARKARVLELAQEKMAQQEYLTIADDIDNQLNQAFSKRTRNISKGKRKTGQPHRPGLAQSAAGGGGGGADGGNGGGAPSSAGIGRQGVGEPIRSLMERKARWTEMIGPVVDYGRQRIPEQTVFAEHSMAPLLERERETWADVAPDEHDGA